jgi:carboxyl-terminal processing protease
MNISFYFLLILFLISNVFAQKSSVASDSLIIWNTQKFRTILETAQASYKDSVDIKKISEKAFSAMLRDLDPYSDYFNEKVLTNYRSNYSNTVSSLGITVAPINDTLIIITTEKNSPASLGGLLSGDRILFIDGLNAVKMSISDFNSRALKSDTLPVVLFIKRNHVPGLMEFNLTPKDLQINSIVISFLFPGTTIGFIKSNRFATNADKEFRDCIIELKSKGAKSIIVDMRQHQGGNVEQAAEVVDEFITSGKTITYIQGKNNDYYQKYISEDGQIAEDLPLVVLIDNQTMSAGEIFAGAIQDLDRGVIAGTQSYGKGMAQKVWEFKDGTAFRLTIGDYFTPSGRNIQKIQTEKVELDELNKLQLGDIGFNEIQKSMIQLGGKLKLPVFSSSKGRSLLGGGGIFPDIYAKDDTTTLLTQVLISKNIILESVLQYLFSERENLIKKFKNDFFIFEKDFLLDDNFLKQIETISRSKNIWNEKMFQTDKEYIRIYTKSIIAYIIWGNDGFYAVDVYNNKSVIKCISLIPEAEKMFNSNK